MKHNILRMTAVLLAAVLLFAVLPGCGSKEVTDDSTAVVFEGEKIGKDEVSLYVYMTQYVTEMNNEEVVSYLFANYETFWKTESGGETYAEHAREDAVKKLIQTRILNLKAKGDGTVLDDEEEAKVQNAIESFRDDFASVVEKSGASDELIEKFVRENAIANKVYASVTGAASVDEGAEEFRRKTFEGVMLYEKYYEEGDEDYFEYTEEELEASREKNLELISERLKNGEAVEDIVSDYAEHQILSVSSVQASVVDPEDAAEEGEEFTSYRNLAWSLSTGEVGTVITKNSAGHNVGYIIRSVNDDDPDERASAVLSALEEAKETAFEKVYARLTKKYDEITVREEILSELAIGDPLFESDLMISEEELEALEEAEEDE